MGRGNVHRNLCDSPFSLFDGISIRFLATPGWVKPPTVSLVEDIAKFASPLTVNIEIMGFTIQLTNIQCTCAMTIKSSSYLRRAFINSFLEGTWSHAENDTKHWLIRAIFHTMEKKKIKQLKCKWPYSHCPTRFSSIYFWQELNDCTQHVTLTFHNMLLYSNYPHACGY